MTNHPPQENDWLIDVLAELWADGFNNPDDVSDMRIGMTKARDRINARFESALHDLPMGKDVPSQNIVWNAALIEARARWYKDTSE